MAKPISIAIDGPAGAGKSTIARRLAKELGFYYVDTGAIYRTVAYFFDLWGVSPKDIDGITRYIDELTIGIEYDDEGVQHMIMNGMDVTGDIRTPELSQKASLVSAHAIVRDLLLDMQREMAEKHNVIMDGRDIGTVVLPKATVKIFLTATPEVRAKRRTEELIAKGQKADYNKILKDIQQRDYQDTHREIAPLKMARDSVRLDTSELDIDGVIAAMKEIIARKVTPGRGKRRILLRRQPGGGAGGAGGQGGQNRGHPGADYPQSSRCGQIPRPWGRGDRHPGAG